MFVSKFFKGLVCTKDMKTPIISSTKKKYRIMNFTLISLSSSYFSSSFFIFPFFHFFCLLFVILFSFFLQDKHFSFLFVYDAFCVCISCYFTLLLCCLKINPTRNKFRCNFNLIIFISLHLLQQQK